MDLSFNLLKQCCYDRNSLLYKSHYAIKQFHAIKSLDIFSKVASKTQLTRKTIAEILKNIAPKKYVMYVSNPEDFIEKVSNIINQQKATLIIERISYNQVEGTFDSNIFTESKSTAEFKNAFKEKKAIHDYVFTDGIAEKSVERRFAEELDNADEVCVYAKLPKGFYIPTPVGKYTPDWAIAFKEGTVNHVYFIAETKGSLSSLQLRGIEKTKIECARRLFNKMSTEQVRYDTVTNYSDLMAKMKSID